ncbi:SCO1/SenC family protein [Burkholderia territorii]|nr:SCO family protein [Burkholderia territorii]VWB86078.1 SCO1/SenC family protein [Burkholderia territorii]
MNRIARSTMGAFVVAGVALVAAPAWCASDGGTMDDAGGAAAESAAANASATENTAPDAIESLMGKDMHNGADHPAENVTQSVDDSAAGSAPAQAAEHEMDHAMEPATAAAEEPAAAPAMAPATDAPAQPAPTAPADNATGKAGMPETESATEPAGMHMHHAVMPGTVHTMVQYAAPAVQLVRDDGRTVSLVKELDDGRPVILTFVYTSCTTICPMISQTLEQLQGELGADRDKVHIMSISIDPEADTPERLRSYAARFGAGPEWQHYTGTVDASVAAQRAFNVYRGDKMNHTPVTFVRAAPGQPWLRIDGFATPTELLAAYRDVVASN